MNILFLTMSNFKSIEEHSIYPDLIRSLAKKENSVTVLFPVEKKNRVESSVEKKGSITLIKVKTGNLFNVSMKEKLISRAGLYRRYGAALNKFCQNEKFDLVLSSTPPTVLYPLINKIKKRDNAYTYLMLKDIFPQNAVDLGMIKKNGIIHKGLRIFEKKLYKSSDTIGCMSPANIKYLLEQDPWIDKSKVVCCPNALEVRPRTSIDKMEVRKRYNIPKDKIVIVYGGALGKPQGLDFFEKCIKKIKSSDKYCFLVIGAGPYLDELVKLSYEYPEILMVIPSMPVDEYKIVVESCDVGMILLDYRFNIPNFPSRMLDYLQAGLPIFSATDENCDVGKISEENGFGFWCKSDNIEAFIKTMDYFYNDEERIRMGEKARIFFEKNYDVDIISDKILGRVLVERKKDENRSDKFSM